MLSSILSLDICYKRYLFVSTMILAAVKWDDTEKVENTGNCQIVTLTDVLRQDHILPEKIPNANIF